MEPVWAVEVASLVAVAPTMDRALEAWLAYSINVSTPLLLPPSLPPPLLPSPPVAPSPTLPPPSPPAYPQPEMVANLPVCLSLGNFSGVRNTLIGFGLVVVASAGICAALNIQKTVHVKTNSGSPNTRFCAARYACAGGCVRLRRGRARAHEGRNHEAPRAR